MRPGNVIGMHQAARGRVWQIAGLLVLSALFTACAASQTPVTEAQRASGVPGFWSGLWHGCIAPITFLVSLFSDHVRIYAQPNSGAWYDFGFMIGIGGFSHGVHRGGAANKRRRQPRTE